MGQVTHDIDIWRAAHLLMQQHSGDAVTTAEQRAAELEKAGDVEGHVVWVRIAAAVTELQRRPAEGEVLN